MTHSGSLGRKKGKETVAVLKLIISHLSYAENMCVFGRRGRFSSGSLAQLDLQNVSSQPERLKKSELLCLYSCFVFMMC